MQRSDLHDTDINAETLRCIRKDSQELMKWYNAQPPRRPVVSDSARSSAQFKAPIPNGLNDCLKCASRIIIDGAVHSTWKGGTLYEEGSQSVKPSGVSELTGIMRRIKHLITVWFDMHVKPPEEQTHPEDYKYCDVPDIYDCADELLYFSLALISSKTTLLAIMKRAPDLMDFVLEEAIEIASQYKELFVAYDALRSHYTKTGKMNERRTVEYMIEERYCTVLSHQAASIMMLFASQLWAGLIVYGIKERNYDGRARDCIIRSCSSWSTMAATANALQCGLLSLYTKLKMQKNRLSNILPITTLVACWSSFVSRDRFSDEFIFTSPDTWLYGLSELDVNFIFDRVLDRLEIHEPKLDRDNETPDFGLIHICFAIEDAHGLKTIERAAARSLNSTFFQFLCKRFEGRDRQKVCIPHLVMKWQVIPAASEIRLRWLHVGPITQTDLIRDGKGPCGNQNCKTATTMVQLRARLGDEKFSEDEAARRKMLQWGTRLKLCASCRQQCYCSITCQAADWENHRKVCRKLRKKTLEGRGRALRMRIALEDKFATFERVDERGSYWT